MSSTRPQDQTVAPVVALEKLFGVLRQRGVRWCHWKSNSHLAAAVRGETDLDLLVDRDQAEVFRQTMAEHDFKPLEAAPGKDYPAVENYLGFDPETGRLIHLHVHYQLILGQQHVKDYRLPIEDTVLDSVVEMSGVAVPSPTIELIILSLRALLKYRLRDGLKDVLPGRRSGIPAAIRAEAAWLLDQTSLETVEAELAKLAPTVPHEESVASIGLLTATSTASSGWRLLILRERVRRALRPTRRLSRPAATVRYLTALGRRRARSLGLTERKRMTPRQGGVMVAFVGADGSGKSTLIGCVEDWLSWRLNVDVLYMGTAQPSRPTAVVTRLAKLARALNRRVIGRLGEESLAARATGSTSRHLQAGRRVAEAKSRYGRYTRARNAASRGTVVLFDRYPLAAVAIYDRSMDGPRIDSEVPGPRSKLVDRLSRAEHELYHRIQPPDRLVALTITAEQSLARKPDHDPAAIEAKTAAIQEFVLSDDGYDALDAGRPLDQVVSDVKALIWGWL